jgi:superfamily I DNA/RNA helicase
MSIAPVTFVPSPQQKAIGRWVARKSKKYTKQHLIVRARAGTGKTTTIVWAAQYAAEDSIVVTSFNRDIVLELAGRLAHLPHVKAKTSHSIGNMLVTKAYGRIPILDERRKRADAVTAEVAPTAPKQIQRLISKLHTLGRETMPHAADWNQLYDLAVDFECVPDETWAYDGYDGEYVCRRAVEAMAVAAEERTFRKGIDFADMIYLPLRNNLLVKMFDMGIIDEAQDYTPAQLELLIGVVRGRIMLVGDDRQAIYGFRGADVDSLDRLKAELDADELGLTVTRRCGKAIVAEAKKLVPDFEAADTNPDGEVIQLMETAIAKTAQPGDFVLSRLNAPLVKLAMAMLRDQKRAIIAGRNIGETLIRLVEKLTGYSTTMPSLMDALHGWATQQVEHWTKEEREDRVEQVYDTVDMLSELASISESVPDLKDRIDFLFTDQTPDNVVTCSTVHRVKGREANRVFVLQRTLYPFGRTREEENIHYVAITRAKQTLFLC